MKVSVVMAGRNSNPTLLKEAIDSILTQTFQDFEFIFVDDGSDKPMESVILSIFSDPRISVYRIEHAGLGAALNHGIEKAQGDYIARIDDDDLMLPSRLERQVEYLDNHSDVSCVGTWFFDKVGSRLMPHRKYPVQHEDIVQNLLCLRWGMAHTTVMFRKICFEEIGGYRVAGGGQDLDLFLQLGTTGQLANISDYLSVYTMSASGLGTVNPKKKEAYLFALNDVVRRDLYPNYNKEAIDSIKKLEERAKRNRIKKNKLIRKMMILRVWLFGKDSSLITTAGRNNL